MYNCFRILRRIMKQVKCPSCASNNSVDSNSKKITCPYCNTTYIFEDEIQEKNNSSNTPSIVNNYYTIQQTPQTNPQQNDKITKVPKTKRPKINIFLLALGLMFYVFPGILYFIYVKVKQKEWDDKYTY